MHTCMYTYMHIYMYIYANMYICIYATYIHSYIHAYNIIKSTIFLTMWVGVRRGFSSSKETAPHSRRLSVGLVSVVGDPQ